MAIVPMVDLSANVLLAGTKTANAAGTGVDTTKYEGPAIVVWNATNTAGTNPTADFKATQCSTSGGTYVDIVSPKGVATTSATQLATALGTTTQVLSLGDINDLKQYVRGEFTIGGTSTPSFDLCAVLIAQAKFMS